MNHDPTQSLIIRPATTDDARNLWQWRNDPLTRAMFKNTDAVSWESHARWFDEALTNPHQLLFIGEQQHGEPVGICRFDIDADAGHADVSLNVNPALRGKGLAHPLLSGAMQIFRAHYPQPLQATIKKQNLASIACFTKCGFALTREDDVYGYYTFNR